MHRKGWHENWLKRVKVFSTRTLRKASGLGRGAVRLTVIDTGVHAAHPDLKRDWSGHYRDFSNMVPATAGGDNELSSEAQEDKPVDNDGHGSFIAGLLLDLVPDLDIYIARIGNTREEIAEDENIGYKIGMVRRLHGLLASSHKTKTSGIGHQPRGRGVGHGDHIHIHRLQTDKGG